MTRPDSVTRVGPRFAPLDLLVVSAIALAGCGGSSANVTVAPADAGEAVDSGSSTSDGGVASSVPIVDQALDGHCPGGNAPGTGVAPGNDLHKVTLSAYPNAICNDGTPAIMYVRKASAPAAASKWVLHMQAGGSCSNYEVCLQRWCGIGAYDAAKMSSRFAPLATSGNGIFSRTAANSLAPANEVYIYYCSSDTWLGRRSDAVLDDPTGANVSYRLHFRGHDILEAAADALGKGVTSDDGAETLPPLANASDLLVTGSSAGSNGLSQHLDWWASKAPNAKSFGLLDSIILPVPEDVDDAEVATKYVAGLKASTTEVRGKLYQGFADESCVAAHPDDDAYLCGLSTHVLLNHTTTPFFARQDLTDPVAYQYLEAAGASLDQYAKSTRKTLQRIATVTTTAEEKAGITKAPGVHASNCGQHIVLLNNPWFGVAPNGNATVRNVGGGPLTLHDGFVAWAAGANVQAIDTQPSTTSVCAATTKDQ